MFLTSDIEHEKQERDEITGGGGEWCAADLLHRIDQPSAYVIISGDPPYHAGSGSKQTHVVNSEPMGSNSKYFNIFINKHCLTMNINMFFKAILPLG